jgi:hypothetical protein
MDTRIFNTALNQLPFQTSLQNKTALVADVLLRYKGPTNFLYNIYQPYTWDSDFTLNEGQVLNYHLINNGITLYFELSANRNLIWGEDSPEYCSALISAFNLTDLIPGVTDQIDINFSFQSPGSAVLPNNVRLTNSSGTSTYLKFKGATSAILFPATTLAAGTPVIVTINVTDFTPGSEKINITWP